MERKINQLSKKAHYLRELVLDMCIKAKTGHLTSSFSCVEILVALYYGGILKYKVSQSKWARRDRFILSKGHASPLLYTVLSDLGFFPKEELFKFAQREGKFGVHLQNDVPGVEITSGSLGQGLGVGAGLALAFKKDKKPYKVFVLLGDGECYEGSIWEAVMFSSHHNLNNLIAIVDRNFLCVTDFTEKIVKFEPLEKKWEGFGWEVKRVDGHSFKELLSVLERRRLDKLKRPLVVIADTVKGKGISFIENKPLWHGIAPTKEKEIKRAREELRRRKLNDEE
ncbi:MAG TPA: transketolase [Candidatus Omnitrophica bacterium]|nr:transketolase [Candidatus Omnitrophota bacterium]